MAPFGAALAAYDAGDRTAELILRREDGNEARLPLSLFFRDEPEFTDVERTALARCRGRVLDIGAGAGSHSLALQRRGSAVTAIDISPRAVDIARTRGVVDVHCADVMTFAGGPFDTLLMLGHGIGMVETIDGLRAFFAKAGALMSPGGQLLIHSMDVRATTDPTHLAYHEANRARGRYIGEVRMRCEFGGLAGPYYGWLQVDAATLGAEAARDGWRTEVIHDGPQGDYLARVTKPRQGRRSAMRLMALAVLAIAHRVPVPRASHAVAAAPHRRRP